jgi:hypothetical protein
MPHDFKPSAPEVKFTTHFNSTRETVKEKQPVSPEVDGFAKNSTVTEFIKLPNGLTARVPNLKTDKFGTTTKKITFVVK